LLKEVRERIITSVISEHESKELTGCTNDSLTAPVR